MLLSSVKNSEAQNMYPNNSEPLSQELARVKETLQREVAYRCRLEAELREARADLKEAKESRDAFQRSMAHKLRSPLNVILGFSEILLDGDPDEETHASLKLIDKGARSLHEMIEGSLQLTELECETRPIQFDQADLHQLVACEIEFFRHDDDPKVSILLQEPACFTFATVDPNLMSLVIRNLLGNAIRVSPEGGEIHCSFEKLIGDRLRVSVKDEGCGIPDKSIEKVFDNFMGSGRPGLGLALSREIIRRHGGRIWAENNKEEGSTFYNEAIDVYTVGLELNQNQKNDYPCHRIY